MTMVTVLPDLLGCLIAYTRASATLAALCGTRISTRVRLKNEKDADGWVMPTHAIVFEAAGGLPIEALTQVQLQTAHIQAHCYGQTMLEAGVVWRTLVPVLCPGAGLPSGFVAAGCRVWQVNQMSGAIQNPEPDTGWPRVSGSFEVIYGEVAA